MSRVMLVYQPVDGGVGRHLRDLSEGLTERGHEVLLCGPALPGDSSAPPAHASYLKFDLDRAIAPRADCSALRALSAIVRQAQPDLIHAHSSKAGAVTRLARIAQPRLPTLYTPHGYAFAGFFSSRIERARYREIERALTPLTSRVVCVCEAEGRLAATLGARKRVRVVYNGIDIPKAGETDPRMVELGRKGPVLCVLTQLRAGKGIETLIDSAPSIRARHHDLQIAIWGDGPELGSLRTRAHAAGVADIVHFPGASRDPLSVVRGATIFVHPSLAESFPYAILEAMSVGRAIVASDVGGIGEALVDGDSGLLCPAGDRQALAQAINGLLDEPERRTRIGAAAQRRVQQHFSRALMIDRLVEVYSEVSR